MPAIKNITPHSVSVDIIEDERITPGAAWFVRKQVRASRRSVKIPGNSILDFPWDVRQQQGVSLLLSRRVLVLLNDAGQVCRVNATGDLIPVDSENNPIHVPDPEPTPVVETDLQQDVSWAGPATHTVDVEPAKFSPPSVLDDGGEVFDPATNPAEDPPAPPVEPALKPDLIIVEENPQPLEIALEEPVIEPVIPELVDLPPLPPEEKSAPSHICPHCGFVSMTTKGLNRHIASCKAK